MPKQPTRADRFRVIRDAIMSNAHQMRPDTALGFPGMWKMQLGSFTVSYCEPGTTGLRKGKLRGHNLNIWPGRRLDTSSRLFLHADKVVNVDWDYRDNIEILSFKGGAWESELLSLLEPANNVRYIARR